MGCDGDTVKIRVSGGNFYSHIPCGMWPYIGRSNDERTSISTHTSRVGCDAYRQKQKNVIINFYSHIPCGMWLRGRKAGKIIWRFLLTHPVWDVTRWNYRNYPGSIISTHTSRVGCDEIASAMKESKTISTHTSRVGCDEESASYTAGAVISTHTSRVGCDAGLFRT